MFDIRSLFAARFGNRRSPAIRSAYAAGLEALDRGRSDDALAAFERACNEATSDAERCRAHNKRGVALVTLGRASDAVAAFDAALGYDERSAAALVNVGNVLLEAGHPLDAVDYYRAAILCDEEYALAQRNLGIAFKRLGRRGEAVTALRTAARLEVRRRGSSE